MLVRKSRSVMSVHDSLATTWGSGSCWGLKTTREKKYQTPMNATQPISTLKRISQRRMTARRISREESAEMASGVTEGTVSIFPYPLVDSDRSATGSSAPRCSA